MMTSRGKVCPSGKPTWTSWNDPNHDMMNSACNEVDDMLTNKNNVQINHSCDEDNRMQLYNTTIQGYILFYLFFQMPQYIDLYLMLSVMHYVHWLIPCLNLWRYYGQAFVILIFENAPFVRIFGLTGQIWGSFIAVSYNFYASQTTSTWYLTSHQSNN